MADSRDRDDADAPMTSHFALPAPPAQTAGPTTTTVPIVVPTVPATSILATPAVETVLTPSSTPPLTGSTTVVQLVKDFIRLKPVYFDGQREFEKVEKWVLSQEKLHRVLQIDDRLRAEISSYTLQRDADVWWRATIAAEGEFESWDAFKTKFYRDTSHCGDEAVEEGVHELETGPTRQVMRYKRQIRLFERACRRSCEGGCDDVYHFGDGLRPILGFMWSVRVRRHWERFSSVHLLTRLII
ncbi:hypothetical protein Scep_019425 [Stephania cephalantha]|uniref:Retrotransposon gag domain-containing protein n=1 Tax=Stephania cephalantha TaxID=152367 RepID=A0AAP0IAM8_9MAGN